MEIEIIKTNENCCCRCNGHGEDCKKGAWIYCDLRRDHDKKFEVVLTRAKVEDVAIKTIKNLIKKNGFRLIEDKRRLGQIAINADVSKEDLRNFLRPLLKEAVDEII